MTNVLVQLVRLTQVQHVSVQPNVLRVSMLMQIMSVKVAEPSVKRVLIIQVNANHVIRPILLTWLTQRTVYNAMYLTTLMVTLFMRRDCLRQKPVHLHDTLQHV